MIIPSPDPATPPSSPAVRPQTTPATLLPVTNRPIAAGGPADPLTALLQSAADPPEAPLPQTDLARRYAENGTLTTRPGPQATPAAPSGLSSADNKLLTALAQTYRSDGVAPAQLSPARQPSLQGPLALVIDGLNFPLTPAQAVAVRLALGATSRRIGSRTESGEIEAPRGPSDTADEKRQPLIRSAGDVDQSHLGSAEEFASSRDDANRTIAAEQRHAALAQEQLNKAAVADPQLVQTTHDVIVPIQYPLAYQQQPEGRTEPAAEIAVTLASSLSRADVEVTSSATSHRITIAGCPTAVEVPAALPVRLEFADGTTSWLHADPSHSDTASR